MPLSDVQIRQLISDGYIKNAHTELTEAGVLSYGVSSYGYDPRLGTKFKIMEPGITPLDPKQDIPPYAFRDFESDTPFVVPANTFFMGYTKEWFHIPRNTIVHVTGKSTYARLGLTTYVTPLEPEWTGHVTLEFRTAERPIVIYPNEGICQFVFMDATTECEVSYSDRKGKYMNQYDEVTHHRISANGGVNTVDVSDSDMSDIIRSNQLAMSDLLERANRAHPEESSPSIIVDTLLDALEEKLLEIESKK